MSDMTDWCHCPEIPTVFATNRDFTDEKQCRLPMTLRDPYTWRAYSAEASRVMTIRALLPI
jgi:hypothetical protein